MIIDLHAHTVYSGDSLLAPEDLIERAIDLGLDAVCVMEHDSYRASETAVEFAIDTPIKIFRGVEVTTNLGHLLVYGIDEAQWQRYEERKNMPVQEVIDYVRECGGVCIPAHPFRFKSPSLGEHLETLVGIFAIEGYNGKADISENKEAWEVAERLNLKMIGGSDAHTEGQLGRCITEFDQKINSMAELVTALKNGHFTARYLF